MNKESRPPSFYFPLVAAVCLVVVYGCFLAWAWSNKPGVVVRPSKAEDKASATKTGEESGAEGVEVDDRAALGQLGDSLGVLNALFSGLALIGAAYAVYLQGHEIREQSKEMALTRQQVEMDLRRARFSCRPVFEFGVQVHWNWGRETKNREMKLTMLNRGETVSDVRVLDWSLPKKVAHYQLPKMVKDQSLEMFSECWPEDNWTAGKVKMTLEYLTGIGELYEVTFEIEYAETTGFYTTEAVILSSKLNENIDFKRPGIVGKSQADSESTLPTQNTEPLA